ncbi:uncharacterized protein LOC117903480 isoform X3 [Drosophila subobscura]|uniref:uncharacterized protein LOC117903480 isoform X3 n=1 Tax=Drosophila subobscura TaxID=7241 RepID=UPI00155A2D8C|nr:uncharacterized protein LOC117903480 isoform X3 [Drosophila subobscura]
MSSTSSSVLTLSSFNLLFFTQVLTVLSSTIKYNEYATDKGGNVSIPCIAQGNIMWVKEHGSNSTIVQTGRVLVLRNVSTSDAGIYVCFATATTTTTTTRATATSPATTTSPRLENEGEQQLPEEETATAATTATATTTQSKEQKPKQVQEEELKYQAYQRTKLTVRTVPGPVTQLYFKASTILGFLIWRFNKTQSGGYPVRSFTAEFRNVSYSQPPANASFEHAWSRMDPINIAPNVRQMEVYRLAPNTTYEFRIWANNELGSGVVVTTNVTTLPETKEEANRMEAVLVLVATRMMPMRQQLPKRRRRHECDLHAPLYSGRSHDPVACTPMDIHSIVHRRRWWCSMMTTTMTRRITNPRWRDSSAKFRYFLQVPPSNVFESTNTYHIGCCHIAV